MAVDKKQQRQARIEVEKEELRRMMEVNLFSSLGSNKPLKKVDEILTLPPIKMQADTGSSLSLLQRKQQGLSKSFTDNKSRNES